jgi:hypothetical protein
MTMRGEVRLTMLVVVEGMIQEVKLRKLYCYEPGTYTKALQVVFGS